MHRWEDVVLKTGYVQIAMRSLRNVKSMKVPLLYTGQTWDALGLKAWKRDWDNPAKWILMQVGL